MFRLRHLLLAGIALLSLTPIVATAGGSPAESYVDVGSWSISYHPDTNRCSMVQTFDRGTTFFVTRQRGVWLFAFDNPLWSERMQIGKRYQITLLLDGYDKWTDAFEARDIGGGEIGLYFNNVSTDFLLGVMRRNRVEVFVQKTGERLTALPLDNSYAAMLKLAECANKVDGSSPRPAGAGAAASHP